MSTLHPPRIPNLLLAGAPKCGTTSLANYLRCHPRVFFALTKEPFFWASDFPELRSSEQIESLPKYLELFSHAGPECEVIAEGSTLYLYSERAIKDSLAFNPEMKYIVMLRRPSDVAYAFHMQMRFHEAEDVVDFETAWRLQDRRQSDQALIPKKCKSPKLLQYGEVAALGSQLESAMRLIPPTQLHVIFFEDFISETQAIYERTLEFLGIASDNRTVFCRDNAAMRPNSVLLTRLIRSRAARQMTYFLKQRIKGQTYDTLRKFKNGLLFRSTKRIPLTREFENELARYFRPEVEKLEQLLDRDLGKWKS